jgi:hypothetical protein
MIQNMAWEQANSITFETMLGHGLGRTIALQYKLDIASRSFQAQGAYGDDDSKRTLLLRLKGLFIKSIKHNDGIGRASLRLKTEVFFWPEEAWFDCNRETCLSKTDPSHQAFEKRCSTPWQGKKP